MSSFVSIMYIEIEITAGEWPRWEKTTVTVT